jgi:hypothetical protein
MKKKKTPHQLVQEVLVCLRKFHHTIIKEHRTLRCSSGKRRHNRSAMEVISSGGASGSKAGTEYLLPGQFVAAAAWGGFIMAYS